MAGPGIPKPFPGRWRQMQDPFRQPAQTDQTGRIVQVTEHGLHPQAPPGIRPRLMAQQGGHPEVPREPGSGAPGHIPAADD